MPTTEKQEDARCAISDVYQSVFSAHDTSALQGGGGIIDSKVAKLNHDVSRCDGKIVAAQRFFYFPLLLFSSVGNGLLRGVSDNFCLYEGHKQGPVISADDDHLK